MRNILLLLCIACHFTVVKSQDFEAKNIKVFPGDYNSHEHFHADEAGNHFIAGRGTGGIDFDFSASTNTLPETSVKDLYLVKYDANDNFDWLLSFEGSETINQIRAIVSDSEGNVYISGAFSGSLQLTPDGQNEISSFGSTSMFVAKFDTDGNLIWQFMVGDTNFSQYPDKMYISENRLIIQFVFAGTFDVDPGPDMTILDDDSNAMLVYGLDGTFIEVYSHKGNTNVEASVMDDEGNLYLSGFFSGFVSFNYKNNASVISSGLFDAFIVKYDKDFNLIWFKRLSKSVASLSFYKLALDANNDILIGALLEDGITIGAFETLNDANYLLKISKEGDYLESTEILPKSSFISHLSTTSKDQIIISARFSQGVDIDYSEEVYELIPQDGDNYYLAAYESDLSIIGSDQINATEINTHTVYVDDFDNIYILTDFVGQGKCALGSSEIFMTDSEENFLFYVLDIEGCAPTSEELIVENCDETIINGETYNATGTYQQILTNTEGCDSILDILVTIYPSTVYDTSIISCGPYEFNGEVFETSGTYNSILSTINGCDSTIMFELGVIDLNEGITLIGNELTANESEGDSYQWYDCDTNMPIEGATNSVFSPETSGSYSVQIFKEACSYLSECISFTLVNTIEYDLDINISPNPTHGLIHLESNEAYSSFQVEVYDLSGRVRINLNRINSNGSIDISSLNSGVYILKFKSGEKSTIKKITLL